VGGLDISYSKYNPRQGVAALVICEYPSMRVLYEDLHPEIADHPYVPGFLAFREVPSLLSLFERLKQKRADLWPQILLVDGNGIMHSRGFGCASHIGVLLDLPSVGCGKTVFAQDGITQASVQSLCERYLLRQGDQIELLGQSGKTWGAAIKSSPRKHDDPIVIS
jgi:deoxyinosine 3'endonuclease (endonuclease V)